MGTLFWPLNKTYLLLILLWGHVASLVLVKSGYGIQEARIFLNHCAPHIIQYEVRHNIPNGLLNAISKVESGRKDHTGKIVPWPWTIGSAGKSFYFPTKEAAISAVRQMQNKGIKNIDVGCMQVNLHYHPEAFKNLHDAFDPEKNVAYAARFLRNLKNAHASWHKAVAHYHSANPVYHIPYRKNVFGIWNKDMKNGNVHLAAAVLDSLDPSSQQLPQVNRIRRLTGRKSLNLAQGTFVPSVLRGDVRRVSRGGTSPARNFIPPKIYRVSGKLRKASF